MKTLKQCLLAIMAVPILIATVPPATLSVQATSKPPDIWAGYSQLKRICSCESWGDPNKEPRQFRQDGSLLRGNPDPMDVGACQISTRSKYGHVQEARKLGLDLFSGPGNIAYGKALYDREGSRPWKWSKSCWL